MLSVLGTYGIQNKIIMSNIRPKKKSNMFLVLAPVQN